MADNSYTELELKKKQMKLYEATDHPGIKKKFSNHAIGV